MSCEIKYVSLQTGDVRNAQELYRRAAAYPRLVEALRHLSTPAHGKDMGHALPSIDQAKAARALLRELGELE